MRNEISAIRGVQYDSDLRTDVLHVYGYRATCYCGWKSKLKASFAAARRERLEHLCSAHTDT